MFQSTPALTPVEYPPIAFSRWPLQRRPGVSLSWLLLCTTSVAALYVLLNRGHAGSPCKQQEAKPAHCRPDLPGCVPKEIKYVYFLHAPKVKPP